jgi:rhodanese-related sulfurtransferase
MADLPIEVSPREAGRAITAGALLVDVREPWEWERSRIAGALLIPLADLPARLGELPEDRDIYVHCQVGARSRRAVEFLRASGRPRSVNVRGGIVAWLESGLDVER